MTPRLCLIELVLASWGCHSRGSSPGPVVRTQRRGRSPQLKDGPGAPSARPAATGTTWKELPVTHTSIPQEQINKPRRWPWVVGAAALFFTGLGVGVASDNDVAGVATSEVTPQSCLDAVDAADAVIDLNLEAFDYVSDAFNAVAVYDIAGINRASEGIASLTDPMGVAADEYRTTSDECRGERS